MRSFKTPFSSSLFVGMRSDDNEIQSQASSTGTASIPLVEERASTAARMGGQTQLAQFHLDASQSGSMSLEVPSRVSS